jgi:hypothetical protein
MSTTQSKRTPRTTVRCGSRLTDVFSILYRLLPSLHGLTAIPRNGDFKQLSTVTDGFDKCSRDEGAVTLENWLQLPYIRAVRLLYMRGSLYPPVTIKKCTGIRKFTQLAQCGYRKERKSGIATGIRWLLLSFIKLIHTTGSRRKQEHKDERKNRSRRSMQTPYIHIMAPPNQSPILVGPN